MAHFRAIRVTCDALSRLLKSIHDSNHEDLPASMSFNIVSPADFKKSDLNSNSVSIFLYRVAVNASQRANLSNSVGGSKNLRPPLCLDLHFLLTAWAPSISFQHNIVGWMMRMMEDYPIIPASFLNENDPDTFRKDETIEIVPGQLTNEELMHIWEDFQVPYQLSIPYVARVVRIDSTVEAGKNIPVVQRDLYIGNLEE